MGIMVAYGSYAKKDVDLSQSINHIELFDTLAAFLAGVMIIPAVYTFMGKEGMSAGPSLMFISLPKVFAAMGSAGTVVGIVFFVMVTFAALTSAMSVQEAIVASFMDRFHWERSKATLLIGLYALIGGIIVCLGYNVAYFELPLPNGAVAQILDLMDYISNIVFMPLVAIGECLLIGWVVGADWIIEEIEQGKYTFGRKGMYRVMVKYVTPVLLFVLFLQAFGVFN
jgi:NSS family neurotransmitter:Na+ symporter